MKNKLSIQNKFASTTFAFLCLTQMGASMALAQGTQSGGGGFGFQLSNGQEVRAGKFINRQVVNTGEKFSFDEKVLDALNFANSLAVAYGMQRLPVVTDLKKIDYTLVKSEADIPQFCTWRLPKILPGSAPHGARLGIMACTVGNHTYFVEENTKGLSDQEFAILIQHEGLRRIPEITLNEASDGIISNYEDAIEIMMNYWTRLKSNPESTLSEGEIKVVLTSLREMYSLRLSNRKPFPLHPYGGGMVEEGGKVSPSAFLSAEVDVNGGSVIGDNVRITGHTSIVESIVEKNSIIAGPIDVRNSTLAENSHCTSATHLHSLFRMKTGKNTRIDDSSISTSTLGADSKITGSRLWDTEAGETTEISDSEILQTKIGLGSTLGKVELFKSSIGNHVRIIHSAFNSDFDRDRHGVIVKAIPSSITVGDGTVIEESLIEPETGHYKPVTGYAYDTGNVDMPILIGNDVHLDHAKLRANRVQIGDRSTVRNVHLHLRGGMPNWDKPQGKRKHSTRYEKSFQSLVIGQDVTLENFESLTLNVKFSILGTALKTGERILALTPLAVAPFVPLPAPIVFTFFGLAFPIAGEVVIANRDVRKPTGWKIADHVNIDGKKLDCGYNTEFLIRKLGHFNGTLKSERQFENSCRSLDEEK